MTLRIAERRDCIRMPAAHPARLSDSKGRAVAQARTANISENGAMLLLNTRRKLIVDEELRLELRLPSLEGDRPKRRRTRTVVYNCRIVHFESVGQMVGAGIELLGKIA